MYPIIDISDWSHMRYSVSGSKEKSWYQNPLTSQLSLFKIPISLTSSTWTKIGEHSGEMWSEKIASEIGNIIGVATHRVDICKINVTNEIIMQHLIDVDKINDSKIYGSLCHSFLDHISENLSEGADLISELDYTYDRHKLEGEREAYTYSLLNQIFDKYGILSKLYEMIVFDTLIGNTDRHQDNFGLIRKVGTQEVRFAPLYDNASSLGRELTQDRVTKMLKDSQMLRAYVENNKARSCIRWGSKSNLNKISLIDFFKEVHRISPEILVYAEKVCLLTDDKISWLVSQIPSEVMGDSHKELVQRILSRRRDLILKEV